MDDATAYMALALNNAQGELSPLEVGLHARGSGKSQSDYAREIGMKQPEVARRIYAANVAAEVMPHGITVHSDHWRHFAELHAAPQWLRRALVSALVAGDWTVEQARKSAKGKALN